MSSLVVDGEPETLPPRAPAYGWGKEVCPTCGESYSCTYRAGKITQRGPCRCDGPEQWERYREGAEEISALARAEAEAKALEQKALEQADLRRAEDKALASECWEMCGKVCRRHPDNAFDVCYACPRNERS